MCGIIGIFNGFEVEVKLKKGLAVMANRGKDASNVAVERANGLGHNLHAIIRHVPQPLEGKFVSNCEIYNWEMLKEKYNLETNNDSETIFELIREKGINVVEEFDGDYSLAYWEGKKVYLARDVLGVKPLWFAHDKSFAFASEKKVLERIGYSNVEEVDPKKILVYEIYKNKLSFIERNFFSLSPEKKNEKKIKEDLLKLLINSVKKRIPEKRLGVLFSGGIDSALIALILKQRGVDFTCYTAAFEEKGIKEADDLVYSERVAKELGLKLKSVKIGFKDLQEYLKKIIPLIEDSSVVGVGVALPFYLACERAKKDGIKVILSGLGSEEIFAGYERHIKSKDINAECLWGLKQMHQRDLYRDDVVTMAHTMELRVPFLDKELVDYALKVSGKRKINKGYKKVILREIAEELGLPKYIAWRKKKAAQYGSGFDKGIKKLSKRKGFEYKKEYLKSLL